MRSLAEEVLEAAVGIEAALAKRPFRSVASFSGQSLKRTLSFLFLDHVLYDPGPDGQERDLDLVILEPVFQEPVAVDVARVSR